MPGEEWEIFAKHAPFVLHDPLFDSEERDPCLEIARLGRALLRTARDGGPLDPTLEALFEALLDRERNYALVDSLIGAELGEWVRAWASFDEPSLRRALQCFVAPEKTPQERFAAFAEVTEEARAIELGSGDADAMTFGALMNFALAPETVPIVGSNAFTAQLWQLKGLDPAPSASLVEGYRQHLDFARQVLLEANAEGVGVRDMLDVQGLVRVCASWFGERRDALWQPLGLPPLPFARCFERQLGGGAGRQDIPYLAVCSCLGYDAPYLHEWIEFHRLVGVERFFLYNRGERDAQRELLAPYVEQGIVVLHEWTAVPAHTTAIDDCIERHRTDARWIAFIDTDEFLFSPPETPLVEVLTNYEEWPAVGVGIVLFGPSGHSTKPDGLVIESYLQPLGLKTQKVIKSIVDPTRTVRCYGGHHFDYGGDRLAVDENHYPIYGAARSFNSFSRLRINHYFTKSEEEFREKLSRPRKDNAEPYPEWLWQLCTEELPSQFESSDDDAILGYVAPLKEALAAISPMREREMRLPR